jgi:hypothetical protein
MRSSPASIGARTGAPGPADLDSTVACTSCGLAASWSAFARVEVLEGATLESHLAVPPDGWFVDVRTCSRCGRPLARKMRAGR